MPALDTQLIARTAPAVVDELGAGALTMEAVASRLGVTEMALYHHVADKSALVARANDTLLAVHI